MINRNNLNNDNRKVAAYVRVSSQKQVEGYSLDSQMYDIKRDIYIKKLIKSEDELVEYRDEGRSGKNMDREGIQQLIDDIKNYKIKIVYMWKIDRVSRDIADFSTFLKILKEYDVTLMAVKSTIDHEKPVGRFMTNMEISVAQLEREQISERTLAGLQQLVREGFYPYGGKSPFGYKRVHNKLINPENEDDEFYIPSRSKGKKLIIHKKEAKVVKQIFMYATWGYTAKEICEAMSFIYTEKALIPDKIVNMIHDERYKGIFNYKGEVYTDVVPQIIDKKTWDDAQKNFSLRKKVPNEDRNYVLNRKVYCSCGERLVNTSGKKKKKIYRYYYCNHCNHGINQDYLLNQTLHRICNFAIQKDKSQKLNKLQEDLKKIDNKAQNLLNQYVNDKINDKYFISTLCLIDERRKNIQKQINSLGSKTINDFLDLTPAEQYRFIHEHLKRINVDIDTRIVISIEYNNH